MARKLSLLMLAFLALVLLTEDCALGIPRWRRRSYGGGGGSVQVAVKNPAALAEYPEVGASYNYNRARRDDVAFTDRIRMFVEIHDADVLASTEPLVAEVRLTDLSNSEHDRIVFVPVALEEIADSESRLGVFEIANTESPIQNGAAQKGPTQKDANANATQKASPESPVADNKETQKSPTQKADEQPLVSPESVYRAFVILHRRAPQYDKKTAWGRLRGPYYVATSGETQLAKARHHIVMRTFKEFYYTERGWRRDENSPLDCHAYYRWATGSCTKGSSYGYANLEWLFDRYHGGGDVADLAEKEAIHADYVRIPGHTFMLLDYDTHLNQVWTMESNFNYTVEVALRPPGSSWTVGHLDASHIREDMFRPETVDGGGAGEENTADAASQELTTAMADTGEPAMVQ